MNPLVWLGLKAFGLSLLLTPIWRDIFRSYKIVDRPDQGRKTHKHPIPRVGGIAIALSYLGALFLFPHVDANTRGQLSLALNVLPGAGVVFAVGLIDDLFGLTPWLKLAGQAAGAGLAYWSGVHIVTLAGIATQDWWSLPLTLFWLLACTNAFNLVDGLDGLAAGVGLFGTLTVFLAALLHGNMALALATFPLAGCLLGFLCYNFNPATIFLGDSGSMLIGFLLGCYGVMWTQKTATLMSMVAPLMALSLPLLDVTLCVIRRALRNQPIFQADRGHIHHRLLDKGLTPRRAVLTLYGVCAIGATLALLQSFLHARFTAIVLLLFFVVTAFGIWRLGYVEIGLARRLLFSGYLQRTVDAQLHLERFERAIRSADSIDECWKATCEAARSLGFARVELSLSGARYWDGSEECQPGSCCELRVPLSETDGVVLASKFNDSGVPSVMVNFADSLRATLAPRLRELESAALPASVGLDHLGHEHRF